ncbi:MAG: molybdenum cofactor biosynthesis protein MoaE, partial [Cyanobium sp.]
MVPAQLSIGVNTEDFDPLAALGHWQRELATRLAAAPAAESSFVGRVRHTTAESQPLEALELEHYPGMTERQLEQLARAAAQRHRALAVLVRHRVGRVTPGAAIVLVAVAADRRGPAQRCCKELLEALKHDAPFWKREWRADGSGTWLSGNTP